MNYYEHHIGDYAAATAHLSLVEDAVYSRMLRRYYLQESPLPCDWNQVARLVGAKAGDELKAVQDVLAEFFTLADDGWHQKRADEDIARFRVKAAKARASANARWDKPNVKPECERNANASETHNGRNALQTPDTRHQKKEQKKGGKPPVELPDWLPADVWQDWHDYRNARKGWTRRARELSLQTLADLYRAGNDPRAVVNRSIERGWTGLFPAKAAGPPDMRGQQSKTLSAIHQLEAMKHGMATNRTADGLPKAALPGPGPDPGD